MVFSCMVCKVFFFLEIYNKLLCNFLFCISLILFLLFGIKNFIDLVFIFELVIGEWYYFDCFRLVRVYFWSWGLD